MSYKAIITKLSQVRTHPNADRLKLATVWGNQIIVGLDAKDDDLGIYFPTDGQLSVEYAEANDLVRRRDADGNISGGMFEKNRRIRTQKFRGEISDGYWAPIESLNFIKTPIGVVEHGDEYDTIGGILICNKYVTPSTKNTQNGLPKKKKKNYSIMFKEHFDTKQLGRELASIPTNAHVIMTEKLHGTSGRVGYVEVERFYVPKWKRAVAWLTNIRIAEFDWKYLIGTRRVVLDNTYNKDTGFHSDNLRQNSATPFIDNLHKGESVYFEIVGYDGESPIMGTNSNLKMGKDFVKEYGIDTIFTYGCKLGEFDVFVYRITTTNESGKVIDYSWQDVKTRCSELNVKHVPELFNFKEMLKGSHDQLAKMADTLATGKSELDSHLKEGVCVRVEGGLDMKIYKHKSVEFKILEGIIKDTGVLDIEESN